MRPSARMRGGKTGKNQRAERRPRRLPGRQGSGRSSPEVDLVGFDRRNGLVMVRQTALPPTLAPRLVSREAAAAYVCVSPNTFDEMVKNGQMPRARLLGERRRAWDARQLDIAIDELPSDGDNTRVDETWSDVDAPKAAASR